MSREDGNQHDEVPVFPILRGESVGEAGEFTGHVVLINSPEQLKREWKSDDIAVLHKDLEQHFIEQPAELDLVMSHVSAVLAEFGDSVSELAATAYHRMTIALVKVNDAFHVLEENMHIRVYAFENQGDVFFID